MIDATEWILAALVIVLGGAAFAVGGQVIRDAWRNGFKVAPTCRSPSQAPPEDEPITAASSAGAGSARRTGQHGGRKEDAD